VWDENAVAEARRAGVGAVYEGAVGGRSGPLAGAPFEGRIRVLALADDVRQGGFFERAGTPMGAAALEIDGVVAIVSGRRQQCVNPEAFAQFGVDPSALDIIVVKSSQHFQAAFAPIAGDILYCDALGPLSQDFASFPYRRIGRPIWPLDSIDRF
jgi:microcystin degradation protein MlrC